MNRHFKLLLSVTLPIFAVLLIGDLVSKSLIDAALPLGERAEFIPGFIDIITVHNSGAAWGMFDGARTMLIVFSFIFLAVLGWMMATERAKNPLFHVSMGFIVAGTIGNLIDRLFFGYVRDFLHFEFWPNFPVFNIADICLVVGIIMFVIYFIIAIVSGRKEKNAKEV